MLRSTLFLRAVPCVALLFAPLAACGAHVSTVGNDSPDSGGASDDCTTQAGIVCNTPDIAEGCTVGPSSCVDGVIHCGQVLCPVNDDAGDCSSASSVCNGPEIPADCTVGPASCSDGIVTCGAVVCTGTGDAGTQVESGDADASDCAGQTAPPCAPPPDGCSYTGPECVDGHLGCGELVCPVTTPDAGTAFSCGDTTCDANTEYCSVLPGCMGSPGGGSSASLSCVAIPPSCAPGTTGACDCVLEEYEAVHGPNSGSVMSNGLACSLTENCV